MKNIIKSLAQRRMLFSFVFIYFSINVFSVDRYWVGGSGNWDASSTTHWSASSGGSGGQTVPTYLDNVYFDANSGSGTVTITASITVFDLIFTGFSGTIAGNTYSLNVKKDLILGSGMFFNFSNILYFTNAPSGGDDGSITSNGVTLNCQIIQQKAGRTLKLADNLLSTQNIQLDNGTFDANNKNVTCTSFSSSNSNTRSLTMGSGTWTLTGDGTIWNCTSSSNLTINCNTSTIKYTYSGYGYCRFEGGSKIYYNVWNAMGGTSNNSQTSIAGSNTFNEIKINAGKVQNFEAGTTQIISELIAIGTSSSQILIGKYNSGTNPILSKSTGIVNVEFCDVSNSTVTGGATWIAQNSTNGGNNSGWIFGRNLYWVGGTASWDGTTGSKWATSSGGTGGAAIPTQYDNVYFDGNSGSGTVTVTAANIPCMDLNFTGYSGTYKTSESPMVYGNLILGSAMTFNGDNHSFSLMASTPKAITSNGVTLTNCSNLVMASAGTWTLQDDLNVDGGIILYQGTFNANNYNVTCLGFDASSSLTRNIKMGSGTWNIKGGFGIIPITNLLLDCGTSTIRFTGIGSTNFSMNIGVGLTFYNIWVNISGGAAMNFINNGTIGTTTFNDLKIDQGITTRFEDGSTFIISSATINGALGNLNTITSNTGHSYFLLSKNSGTLDVNYCNLSRCHATGGATFNAYNSIDGGNNSGWNFTSSSQITSHPSDTTICEWNNAFFAVGATGASLSYQWQVNKGSGFNNITPVSNYSGITDDTLNIIAAPYSFNNYSYRCVVSGVDTSQAAKLTVKPGPNSDFTISKSITDSNVIITYTGNAGTGATYTWNFDNGIINSGSGKGPYNVYWNNQGNKTISLEVSENGCLSPKTSLLVTVFKGTVTLISSGDTSICEGDSIALFASTRSTYTYQWKLNDNTTLTGNKPYYYAKVSGKYHVVVTDTALNVSVTSNSINIKVSNADFKLAFFAWDDTQDTFDSNPPFDFAFFNQTPNRNKYKYSWFFGDGDTSFKTSPIHTYQYNGIWTISLFATDLLTGCTDSISKIDYITTIGGSNDPCASFKVILTSVTSPLICLGDSVKLMATYHAGALYKWTLDDIIIPNANSNIYYAKEKGDYKVFVDNLSGCWKFSLPLTVSQYASFSPIINSQGSISPCSNDSIKLFVDAYYTNFKWYFNYSSNPFKSNSSFAYVKNSGDYHVIATDIYGCNLASESFLVNKTLVLIPSICLVTSDTLTSKNLIIWERPKSTLIKYYNIYKETTQSNVFNKIGTVPYSDIGAFVDITSIPKKNANRYRISLIDSCGNESALSIPHKTLHLTANKGAANEINLIWSHYEGIDFSTYKIYRGKKPTNLQLLDSVASNLNSYTDLNPINNGISYYMISIEAPMKCYPAIYRGANYSGPYSQSYSNLKDYSLQGEDYLEVFPSQLNVSKASGTQIITVYSNKSDWTVKSNDSWITTTEDQVNGNVLIDFSENTNQNSRVGSITFSASGLTDVVISITQNGTSSINKLYNKKLKIYPCPSNDYVIIEIPEALENNFELEVFDQLGKKIAIKDYKNNGTIVLNTISMSKGIYLVTISGNNCYIGKIIKN